MKKGNMSGLSIIEICDKVSKTSVYLLTFLLPIMFLPWTANVLDFNKQALLITLVFIAMFAWMLKILVSGKASFNFSVVHIPIITLFVVYAVSSIFSLWRTGSFWGWPNVTSESLITLLSLVLLYFLIVNAFKRKEIFYLAVSLAISGFLATVYGLLQLLGKFILPISFTKSIAFNTVGGINTLAVFTAIMLPLAITFLTISKDKKLKILFVASTIVSAILLLLINFKIAWWVVIAGCALIIIFGTQKRDVFDGRWLILPMFFMAIALLFSFFNFSIPGTPQTQPEYFLTQRATFDISWKALQESPVIGSGPGTFEYNFSRLKSPDFNKSTLWNLKFDWGSSKMLTVLGTVGILGILGFLALIGFFIFYGVKFLFGSAYQHKSNDDEDDFGNEFYWTLGMGIFISFLATSILFFLYKSNVSIDFVYFVLMACFVSLLYPVKKEIVLKPSSLLTLAVTFSFTLLFIFGLGILILEGQRYVSAVSYLNAATEVQAGRGTEAIGKLETAIRISPRVDLYWREIAQMYLSGVSSAEDNQNAQAFVNGAVNAAKAATETNPKNVDNWSIRGYIYQNLIGTVGGTKDWSVSAYEEALKLEPINPFFPTQAGISIMKEVSGLGEERKGEKSELIAKAKEKFNQAIELKSDYASAHFQLAMAYQAEGDQENMATSLETTKEVAPFDVGVAFQLGVIYYQMKDFKKAQQEFERTLLLSPGYANALYFLGLVYDEQGETDKALQVFEALKANNPENGVVIQILKNLKNGEPALSGMGNETSTPKEVPGVPIDEDIQEQPVKEE
ncbi:tetratricopeptide repeat protein [Patescibacteria group bacterium]|nr:tetratricopeptide repeat protein [Patescibacteria group bacterium]